MIEDFRSDRPNLILFICICIAGFFMRLACTTGLIGSDDLFYSHFARLISNFSYKPESIHWALRYGLTIPVAILYRVLGVREWTTFLLPLLASAASLPLLMMLGARLVGVRAALIAGILFASFSVSLRYATILVPEPVLGFYLLIALLLYLESEKRRPLLFGVSAGLVLGFAYLTKEPGAFVGLAVLLDAALRRKWAAAFGICAGMFAVVAMEFSYYLATTGDLLFRFHSLKIHEQSAMVLAANQDLSYRLFKSYPRLMIVPNKNMGLHSIFALLASLSIFKWRPPRVLLLVLWGVLPWLYLNFGSSSLSHFTALPNADRYIEFCYVPLFLVVGFILDQWVAQRPSAKLPAMACLTIVAATGFWCAYVTRQQGWRTADAAFLRRIAGVARQTHTKTISIQGDTNELWEQEMAILAPGMTIVGPGRPADLVIGPDAAGLPSVVSVPAKR